MLRASAVEYKAVEVAWARPVSMERGDVGLKQETRKACSLMPPWSPPRAAISFPASRETRRKARARQVNLRSVAASELTVVTNARRAGSDPCAPPVTVKQPAIAAKTCP